MNKVDNMKAYEDLTRRGRLRRIKRIAQRGLDAFGFHEVCPRLIIESGNILYRVKTMNPMPTSGNLYVDNCFLLRLHWPGYQSEGAIESELEWLSALCNAGLPVPQPVPTIEGELSVEISIPGVPESRRCSLLRWVKGRRVMKHVRRWHMTAIGNLMARFHNHASSWKPPPHFVRRHYDHNGLWGDDTGTSYTADEVWPRIRRRYFEAFREVTLRVERVMEDWGKELDVYGLIHADLGTNANVLFYSGEARAIDFDDGGFGYWMYDLAVALCDWEGMNEWSTYRDALLEGYLEMRSIPEEQLKQLQLFQAAYRAVEIFWATAGAIRFKDPTYWMKRQDAAWKHIKRYLRKKE